MDSPASRLRRVLLGILVSMVFLTSISMGDGSLVILDEDISNADNRALAFPALAAISGLLLLAIRNAGGREYGNFFLDRWVSREQEEEMMSRLILEQEEAGVEKMGGAWAELEKVHLERRLEEE
ncbi:MAG TPA: hypothetical protein HA315_03945 [Candidatus Thalassarchaeaceae archaeon]|jgi:hypothetical protein|nr:hypothetical protein [Euryarchaeota archaeon]DAC43259.1 MAG TPA: hypothetical protein D7H72_03935 [Candidatus Poseidoniales archaeon]HII35135.1 hypothetical protein [Candidatus Thalassarchaeaceae archaeon]|tara:strand:- start:3044 stop:3415 length:372 start_codon:yes stop_codon:yes gene_type:complete